MSGISGSFIKNLKSTINLLISCENKILKFHQFWTCMTPLELKDIFFNFFFRHDKYCFAVGYYNVGIFCYWNNIIP